MDDKLSKPVRIGELKAVARGNQQNRIRLIDLRPNRGLIYPCATSVNGTSFWQVDDSEEFVTQVLQLFIEQAEQLASRLPELADDPEVLASEAHKLKGAAAYVGAVRAAYFCGIVENAAKLSHPFTRSESCH